MQEQLSLQHFLAGFRHVTYSWTEACSAPNLQFSMRTKDKVTQEEDESTGWKAGHLGFSALSLCSNPY